MHTVLVQSGCYNRRPETRRFIDSRHLHLMVLEAVKSRIRAMADSVSGESLLPD